MKKVAVMALAAVMATGMAVPTMAADLSSDPITVVSREDGSGTRGAFIELFGVEEKDADGNKVDNTTEEAEITNNTAVMMSTVAGDVDAIGYISLGSLNDSVKAAKIDGVEATAENIKSGEYKVSRPFNIATNGEVSDVAQDFIDYILSPEGQAVVEENGYVSQGSTGAFDGGKVSGKITVAGSSSVSPVMEKLIEAYKQINTKAEIELQTSDSSAGMQSALEGTCDIGMASRELKDTETALTSTTIAKDGIAVIVNTNNTTENLTMDQVKALYTGEAKVWSDITK